jgi:EAL domain-containing protein (putative c-di-GMP-specific phosphodiesterase class I)
MKVLLIDDDPFTLRLLDRQLGQVGVRDTTSCDRAATALALLDADAGFDVVFCDLNMPDVDGVELLRALARRRFDGAVVLMSGEEDRILQSVLRLAKAHDLDMLGAVGKPVPLDALQRLLTAARGPRRPGSAPRRTPKAYGAAELRDAVASGHLVNYYQPQVDMATRRVVGVEALVRWQHREDGLLSPDRFLPTAEAFGMLDAVARRVLATAFSDARRWRDQGLRLRVGINVSIHNLEARDFADTIAVHAAAAGVPTDMIVLEVTESQVMRDPLAVLDTATRLRLKRVGLSIDDFGTGFASLAQLRDMPFDELKLDRSFVHGAATSRPLQAMLRANVAMAQQLGLRTVAEGVEDRDDWDSVRAIGCHVAQGFLIARPMPADHLASWVLQWNPQEAGASACQV